MENEIIECINLYGQTIQLPKKQFKPTTRVYAVVVHDGKLLVITIKSTGRYYFPGGGVDDGESLERALHREMEEEVGVEIEIVRQIHQKHIYFYHDTLKEAMDATVILFECKPLTFDLKTEQDINDIEAGSASWLPLIDLDPSTFQFGVQDIAQMIKDGSIFRGQ